MKSLTIIFISFLFPFTVFANIPTLPEGSFQYTGTTVHSTDHLRILNLRSPTDQKLYEDYKELGYTCTRKPNSFVKCRKSVGRNPNQIEFKTEALQKLSATFGELIAVNTIRESEVVDTYDVRQEVVFEGSSTNQYKVYQNHESGKTYLDIQTSDIKPKRFKFRDHTLLHLSFERERIGKNEHLVHILLSTYK